MSDQYTEITELLELCLQARPEDLGLVELYIKNIGANALLPHSAKPLPAAVIHNFVKHSVQNTTMLARYIELFLQNGFDAAHLGAACLHALTELNDEQLLVCAQLLLEHGVRMSFEEYRSLLRTVSFQCAYHDWHTQNYYKANLCFAYRQMLSEYFTKPAIRHTDIAHYTCACNKPIINLLFARDEQPLKHLYITLPDGILIIQNHPNIYMCSSIEAPVQPDKCLILTPHPLSSLLNKRIIRNIGFTAPPANASSALPHPDIRILFDTQTLLIRHNTAQQALEISLI